MKIESNKQITIFLIVMITTSFMFVQVKADSSTDRRVTIMNLLLQSMQDTFINSPSSGDILVYNGTYWENNSTALFPKYSNCLYNINQVVGGTTRTIQATNCFNGKVDYSSTNASFVFNSVMQKVNSNYGGLVHVKGYNTTHPYNVTAPIIIPDNGHLYFEGEGAEFTVLKIPVGSDNNLFQYSGTKTGNSFFNYWGNFQAYGNPSGTNNRGFVFNGTSFGITDSIIYNVFLRNFKQDDIYLNGVNCWNNRLDSDTIELAGRAGLYVTGTTQCQDVRILNNKFLYNIQYGVYSDATEETYNNNWFYKNQQVGAKLNGESRSVWDTNRFMDNSNSTNNGYYDMWILGSYNTIVGNQFYGSEAGVNKIKYSVFFDTFENHNTFVGNTFGSGLFGTQWVFFGTTSQSLNRVESNQGYNPFGVVASPFYTTGSTIMPTSGNSATPNNATDYTVNNSPIIIDSTGGVGVSIILKDASGNTITSGLVSLSNLYVPVGDKIRFTFATVPTVTVAFQ